MQLSEAQWDEVCAAYAADVLSVAKIVRHFKITPSQFNRRRAEENWPKRADRGLAVARPKTKLENAPSSDRPNALEPTVLEAPHLKAPARPSRKQRALDPHRQMQQQLNRVFLHFITALDEQAADDAAKIPEPKSEYLKLIDLSFKVIERSQAMSADTTAPNQPESSARQDGKERAAAAARMRDEIADRLERLRKQTDSDPKLEGGL